MSAPLSERSETDSEVGLKGHASKRVAQIEVLAGLLSTNDVWIALEGGESFATTRVPARTYRV